MTALVIRRLDFPRADLFQIVGHDVTGAEAADLVEMSRATYHDVTLPAAVYLQTEITIGGQFYPAGAMLTVGGQITEAQCLALMRGLVVAGGEHAPVG